MTKQISQIVTADGQPVAAATSAPGCFIYNGQKFPQHPDIAWGDTFSDPREGNDVDFYVTGAEYFTALVGAIAAAKESIYITGWQVNFDVELTPGVTLFQCLEKAIDNNDRLKIFVMPWLSPKVGVDTGDFETMLAIFQLNAGLKDKKMRAFALPAIAQSDMPAGLGIGFSHHQKLVVIDDRRAFVGGIDIAYGRRDDGRFLLSHDGRVGNELYNTCIPPVENISAVDQTKYLTRAELFAACFDGKAGKTGTFLTSAPMLPIAFVQDVMAFVGNSAADGKKWIGDRWNTADLTPGFVRAAQDVPVDFAQAASRFAYAEMNRRLNGKLDALRETGSAHAADAAAAVLAWLNNASMDQLPAELRQKTIASMEVFLITTLSHLSERASQREKRYKNLQKLGRIVPKSGKTLSNEQPRMPWHDVHCSITGPSVSDLSRNFALRWNSVGDRYRRSHAKATSSKEMQMLFYAVGLPMTHHLRVPSVPLPPAPATQKKTGKCWVQVVRSAPKTLLKDEAASARSKQPIAEAQNNCLQAMLTAIYGSQKFLYIEGQFFQSAYGIDFPSKETLSGPMLALIDITSSPNYEKHSRRLGIYGVAPQDIPAKIRVSQIDDVRRDVNGKGADFRNDLDVVLANVAAIKMSVAMGEPQAEILNPIGEAIAKRIEQAIYDGLPYHVYMVLPVHPEGTLNTLNIMTQIHLTMQSLVFGSKSLINRIRRALLVERHVKKTKSSQLDAIKIVATYKLSFIQEEAADDWKHHLTLLNLRNWETLGERAVTEQVYIHSKLLISDDRVAVLGSANINDRSQCGDRDSELAVVVRGDEQITVKLDGVHDDKVSACVHRLRVRLWRKIFGLAGSSKPARLLAGVINQPAAEATWYAIQECAEKNAQAYQRAFPYLAHVNGKASSIWPPWNEEKKRLNFQMPFSAPFWRGDEIRDESFYWREVARAPEAVPVGIRGFIVGLPVQWTAKESNWSGMNLTLLAKNGDPEEGRYVAVDNAIEVKNNDMSVKSTS